MKVIKQTCVIKAPVEIVWKALTDPKCIDEWGGGPAKMSDQVGFKFSLWDGEISGKNIELILNRLLVQEWTEGEWEKPSVVRFSLVEDKNKTIIDLVHSDYPESEHDDLESGWKDFYMGPLKKFVEKNT